MRRIYLLFILLAISVAVSAKKENNSIPVASVEIIPSPNYFEVTTKEGNSVSFPKYEQVISTDLASFFVFENSIKLSGDYSYDAFRREYEKAKEMESLSEKLGIEITNGDYLDFYREVAGWLGTRYRMGGMSRSAVDCSGFTNIIYNKVFQKEIPRVSKAMANNLAEELPLEELMPGDLLFFNTRGKKQINHVGMYLGEGYFVHASIKGVKVSDLTTGYYQRTFNKAGRI